MKPQVINEKEAALYLGISLSKLRQTRLYGGNARSMDCPPYIKLGRNIRYRIDDLKHWLNAKTTISTAIEQIA